MTPDSTKTTQYSLVRRIDGFDNPYLRHFIRKHRISDADAVVLGILLELTNQMKTPIKTSYGVIASSAGMSAMDTYRSIDSLHRHGIIQYRPEHDFVHIGFNKLEDEIEEITLAHRNARKIKVIERTLERIRKSNYVPADDLFDLIYPIIGQLVAKKIADALRALVNYIDAKLNSSLSLSMWRYRWISFRKKIPLAEVILRESLPFLIDEIFLLHKKTSIVLAHVSRSSGEAADSDLIGGMLSAINDFIATSFKKKGSMLNEIQFGEWRIVIAESVYFFAAFVARGSYQIDFLEEVESLFKSIHGAFRRELKDFKGKMKDLEGIEQPLRDFMNAKNSIPAPPGYAPLRKVKIAGAVLAALLALLVGYGIYGGLRDYRVEKRIERRLAAALPANSADIRIDVDGERLRIEGYAGSPEIVAAMNREALAAGGIKDIDNRALIVNFVRVEEYEDIIRRLESQLESMQLSIARQELEQIVVQFPTNVVTVGPDSAFQIRRAFEILRQYPHIRVKLIAFADPAGGFFVNKMLAHSRLGAVKKHLVSLGVAEERISIREFDLGILDSDPKMSRFRDRRGIMIFAESAD